MGATISRRIVDALPFLDRIAEAIQPKVQEAVEAGGTTARNALDGTWLEVPLHPALTDVPVGSWTAALVFDGLDLTTDSRSMRNAADASLAFGVLGALGAAITGLSDWRYLEGGSRRMGVAHGLLNAVGRALVQLRPARQPEHLRGGRTRGFRGGNGRGGAAARWHAQGRGRRGGNTAQPLLERRGMRDLQRLQPPRRAVGGGGARGGR